MLQKSTIGRWRKRVCLAFVGCCVLFSTGSIRASDERGDRFSRRELDSLNVYHRRNIRLNQIGYRPKDARKHAFVAGTAGDFSVIDVKDGSVAYSGTLTKVMDDAPAGKMTVRGVFNSITDLYHFTHGGGTETLYCADFSVLNKDGRYMVKVGADTSAVFHINGRIYNYVLETALNFFGSNRCGNTDSWIHEPCHLKDGSELGSGFEGALSGGWHDCGDHGKYCETQTYAALILALTYAIFPHKAEDLFGKSYEIKVPDGIPDILYEAKIGADYVYKLYKVSRAKGLIAAADMYHSVGDLRDHSYWDVPENQEAQPPAKGGPPRAVHKGIGSNVAGMFSSALAFFSWGWRKFDPAYADSLKNAAIDIYDNVVMKKLGTATSNVPGYTGGGRTDDDEAMAALALWFITKDERFSYDLYKNKDIKDNPNHIFVPGQFPAGHMGSNRYFHHGGWTTDYEQIHIYALYAFAKLILKDVATASSYGVSAEERDTLLFDIKECLKLSISTGSNGANGTSFPGINVDEPYHGVFTSVDWGFNRYNMGMVNELFVYWDLTGSQDYFSVGIDNLNYNMGLNPWDMSFIMEAGDRNLQHPHNRAANPDGYNAGGFPYDYQSPTGALMGGAKPDKELLDDWEDYTATETCIDFSAQLILPAMILSDNSIIDTSDLFFFNVVIEQVGMDYAIVSWETNKMSKDVLRLALQPNGTIIQEIDAGPYAVKKVVTINGLTPNTTYYFYLRGVDLNNKVGVGDNNGLWYTFTTLSNDTINPVITDVRVCNITHDQATVFWWTKNGKFDSKVEYGKTASLGTMKVGDDTGLPVVIFHSVTLTGLEPNTTYYFDVISGTIRDDNNGQHYTFKTTEVLVNYEIRIKPTKKGGGSSGTAHFYIDIANKESQPYTGLEIRFYYQLPESEAPNVVIHSNDKAIFDAGGMMLPLDLTINNPVRMTAPGYEEYWYIPLVINSELPVAGRARIEFQMNLNAWDNLPFSKVTDAWSIASHTLPVPFSGVDLSKGDVYVGPDIVEIVNNIPEVTYTKTPYITAYYKGVHVYGYPPDYEDNIPNSYKTVILHFTEPFESPVSYLMQDSLEVTFAGRTWAFPDGNITDLEKNGKPVTFTPINNRKDSVSFSDHITNLTLGTNTFTWVAWHNKEEEDCACDQKRVTIEVDTGTIPLPPKVNRSAYFDNNGDGFVDSVTITYTDTLNDFPDSVVLYWPDKSGERKKLLKDYTGMKLTSDKKTLTISVAPSFTSTQTSGDGIGQCWHTFFQGGTSDSVPEFDIIDSVGPRLLNRAYFYERFLPGNDTLVLELSEDIRAADVTQAAGVSFILIKPSGEVSLTILENAGSGDLSTITIAIPDLGDYAPAAGDSIRIYAQGPVKDVLNNKAHEYNPPVPIVIRAKPVPIDTATYWDLDANGIVELLRITLKKKITIAAIEKVDVTFGSDAATASESDISYLALDSTTIQVMLTDIFDTDVLESHGTGGSMSAAITYNGVSGTESASAIDSAAPVIASAHYIAGELISGTNDREPDGIEITFTEDVESNVHNEPFLFFNTLAQTTYRILLESSTWSGNSAAVVVDTIIGRRYPSNGDSIWINTVAGIEDWLNNVQGNERNRKVPMEVDPQPYNLVIKAVTPVIPKEYTFSSKILSRLEKSISFNTGVYIRVDPQTESDGEHILRSASVKILDAVGNCIASCNDIGDDNGILVIQRDNQDEKLHVFWSGQNENRRYVGHGVYVMLIEVTDKDEKKILKKVSIGVQELLE